MKTKEIRIRAIDCERLNMQVVFVNYDSDHAEAKKNALLINAAEDMLDALQEIKIRMKHAIDCGLSAEEAYDSFYSHIVDSAIAKATQSQNNNT